MVVAVFHSKIHTTDAQLADMLWRFGQYFHAEPIDVLIVVRSAHQP